MSDQDPEDVIILSDDDNADASGFVDVDDDGDGKLLTSITAVLFIIH